MKNLSETLHVDKKGIHVLAGVTGDGLTTTAMQISMELGMKLEPSEDKRRPAVAFFSRELGVHEFVEMQNDKFPNVFQQIANKGCEILFFNSFERDTKDFEFTLNRCAMEYDIQAIVFDNIAFLPQSKLESRELQNVFIALEGMMNTYDCPVIAGLKMNRDVNGLVIDIYDQLIPNLGNGISKVISSAFRLKRHNEMLDVHVSKSDYIIDFRPMIFNMNDTYTF